jgi:phospholipid/cholesterol/gamma-HCH transport system substrate-binding protein
VRRTRRDLVLTGLFVLFAGGVLAGGLAWIAGARVFRTVDRYTVKFDRSVSGLAPGAVVEFQGVNVGRVERLYLTEDLPPQVAVAIAVVPGTPIRTDTRAALVGSLVTGIKYVQLEGGRGEPLPLGSTIAGDVGSLDDIQERVTDVADRFSRVLTKLDDDVFTPDNNQKLGALISDVSAVARELRAAMERFREEETGTSLVQLVKQVGRVADRLDGVLAGFQSKQGDVLTNLNATIQNLNGAVTDSRGLLKALNSQLTTTGGSLGGLLADLTRITAQLEETLDVIRSDPSLLIRGRTPDADTVGDQ